MALASLRRAVGRGSRGENGNVFTEDGGVVVEEFVYVVGIQRVIVIKKPTCHSRTPFSALLVSARTLELDHSTRNGQSHQTTRGLWIALQTREQIPFRSALRATSERSECYTGNKN